MSKLSIAFHVIKEAKQLYCYDLANIGFACLLEESLNYDPKEVKFFWQSEEESPQDYDDYYALASISDGIRTARIPARLLKCKQSFYGLSYAAERNFIPDRHTVMKENKLLEKLGYLFNTLSSYFPEWKDLYTKYIKHPEKKEDICKHCPYFSGQFFHCTVHPYGYPEQGCNDEPIQLLPFNYHTSLKKSRELYTSTIHSKQSTINSIVDNIPKLEERINQNNQKIIEYQKKLSDLCNLKINLHSKWKKSIPLNITKFRKYPDVSKMNHTTIGKIGEYEIRTKKYLTIESCFEVLTDKITKKDKTYFRYHLYQKVYLFNPKNGDTVDMIFYSKNYVYMENPDKLHWTDSVGIFKQRYSSSLVDGQELKSKIDKWLLSRIREAEYTIKYCKEDVIKTQESIHKNKIKLKELEKELSELS